MTHKFHQRFNIEISSEEAKRRFVNRAHNHIADVINFFLLPSDRHACERAVCSKLGIKYDSSQPLIDQIGTDFEQNLLALEGLYQSIVLRSQVDKRVREIQNDSEVDLGIHWDKGHFWQAGAPLLDEKAVNDVLGLLSNPAHEGAAQAFQKGLDHFMHSTKQRELLSDVVNRMYEALEALAKVVCKNDKDLSSNREALVSKLELSDHFKRMLKDYVEYANDLHRHAGEKGQAKPPPSRREVEAFVYLTGLVIRLALSTEK